MPQSSSAVSRRRSSTSARNPSGKASSSGRRRKRQIERFDATPEHEPILVEHDLISQADLAALQPIAHTRGATVFDLLIEKGVYTAEQLELCLTTNAWLQRSTSQQIEFVTSEQSISRYRHDFALHGYFTIPHVLSRDELYALDVALHRISLAHVDSSPRHKLYHSIGGKLLFTQKPVVDLIGHPSLLAIARAFLGDDLVAGKHYLKIDEPHMYRGMFGHTHAETHYDCLTRGMYMFLYMDAVGHDYGAFQILPGSHERYSRNTDGRTLFDGKPLDAQSTITNKASLTHDEAMASRWAGYESLSFPANTLVVLSPFLWHAVRPVLHRRRLIFLGYFDAAALTREFVLTSDYFGDLPYDLRTCDLSLLSQRQKDLLAIHLDREAWLRSRGR